MKSSFLGVLGESLLRIR